MGAQKAEDSGFSKAEREAMKARAKELAAEQRESKKKEDGEKDVLSLIEAMEGNDKTLAQAIHELVMTSAPGLWPKTWYGMPAYAHDGKVVCFFQAAKKFEARYATFGFNDTAKLDKGTMWATSFALTRLGPAEKQHLSALLKEAL
jgi:uncharacterized protein YdhG (YjbR/CyaY superfamily)